MIFGAKCYSTKCSILDKKRRRRKRRCRISRRRNLLSRDDHFSSLSSSLLWLTGSVDYVLLISLIAFLCNIHGPAKNNGWMHQEEREEEEEEDERWWCLLNISKGNCKSSSFNLYRLLLNKIFITFFITILANFSSI